MVAFWIVILFFILTVNVISTMVMGQQLNRLNAKNETLEQNCTRPAADSLGE